MCGCERHWKVTAKCTCYCPEHLEHRIIAAKASRGNWLAGTYLNDDGDWLSAWGFTEVQARRRLIRKADRRGL